MNSLFVLSTNHIIFGVNALTQTAGLLKALQARKTLIVTDAQMIQHGLIQPLLEHLRKEQVHFDVFSEVEPSPTEESAEKCGLILKEGAFEAVIGFGGGSSLDVAKASAILVSNPLPIHDYIGTNLVKNSGLPVIAIPTTAGTGSEVTAVAVLKNTEHHTKAGIVSPYILPKYAIIDPLLTLSLPPAITASTGMDALSHAVEGYTSLKASPFSDMFHEQAIRRIAAYAVKAVNQGGDLEARSEMALAATFAGLGLAYSGATAAHAMAYPIEGKYKMSHGNVCAALLPAVVGFNAIASPEKFRNVALWMGQPVEQMTLRQAALQSAEAIRTLNMDLKIPGLSQAGVTQEDIPVLAAEALEVKRILDNNPRIITLEEIKTIYEASL